MRKRILIVALTLAATVGVASPFGTTETLFEDSFLAYAPVADVTVSGEDLDGDCMVSGTVALQRTTESGKEKLGWEVTVIHVDCDAW